MNSQIDLTKVLSQTMKFLGYSEKLTDRALGDLEKIISTRYYQKLITMLPISAIGKAKIDDVTSIVEIIKINVDQDKLNSTLIDVTKETINEYFEEISKE